MPTIADILGIVDALKRGLATNPGATIGSYAKGAAGGMGDMVDMVGSAFGNPMMPNPPVVGPTIRNLLNSEGTPTEQAGGLLGLPIGTGAKLAALAAGKVGIPLGGLLGQMVFHGTPHQFDKYDLSKIGTGQGEQSYGHGIYFAENPATASSYRDLLSSGKNAIIEGGNTKTEVPRWLVDNIDNFGLDTAITDWTSRVHDAKSELSNSIQPWLVEEKLAGLQKTLDDLHKIKRSGIDKVTKPGIVYSQDLPDEVLPKMLQWDRPLSEQPAAVQKSYLQKLSDLSWQNVTPDWVANFGNTGEGLFNLMSAWNKHDPALTAQAMKEAGIPGLSYLDQGSRASGKGTLNHVIWDQSLLDQMAPTRYSP